MAIDAPARAAAVGVADREHAEELRARLARVERMLADGVVRDLYLQHGAGTVAPQPVVTRGDLERLRAVLLSELA